MSDDLSLGGSDGLPAGWSNPGDVWNKQTLKYDTLPMVWVDSDPATDADEAAILNHRWGEIRGIDHNSTCGKDDPDYTTEREIGQEKGIY